MAKQDPTTLLPLTPATFHILLTLHDGPLHGYGVKREVEERTDGVVRLGAGTLYEAIQRLDRLGLITASKPPAGTTVESKRWRFYRITPSGKRVLRAELHRLETDVSHAHAKGLVGRLKRA